VSQRTEVVVLVRNWRNVSSRGVSVARRGDSRSRRRMGCSPSWCSIPSSALFWTSELRAVRYWERVWTKDVELVRYKRRMFRGGEGLTPFVKCA